MFALHRTFPAASLALLILLLGSVTAEEVVGTIGREVPDQIGVYVVEEPNGNLEVGTLVEVWRGNAKLGEAFLVTSPGVRPWVSLRGVFAVKPGDVLTEAGREATRRSASAGLAQKVPDMCQRNPKFPLNGSQYCGPVAVSNTLWWLSQNGHLEVRASDQVELVRDLAAAMGTDTDGTGPAGLMRGLRDYLREAGYSATVTYRGWRQSANRRRGDTIVDATFLQSGIGDGLGLWVNLGWYRSRADGFQRLGGHWVTVVGVSSWGKELKLLVHDPSPRSGAGKRTQEVLFEKIEHGELTGSDKGLPQPAAGLYRIRDGLPIGGKGDTAIIDGAVVLAL